MTFPFAPIAGPPVTTNSSNPLYGLPLPIKPSGRYFYPPGWVMRESGLTVSTTAARYYIIPWYVDKATTFAGAWCYNSGAGDNGDKVKIALYSELSTGGPGLLAKNFGEVTLTGASALRSFASSYVAAPGQYYLELVTDNAVSMYVMTPYAVASAVGFLTVPDSVKLGYIGGPTVNATAFQMWVQGDYVGGTYANFPESTSLTPATTLTTDASVPVFGLYT